MLQVMLLAVPSLVLLSVLVYLERDVEETVEPSKGMSRKARKRGLPRHR